MRLNNVPGLAVMAVAALCFWLFFHGWLLGSAIHPLPSYGTPCLNLHTPGGIELCAQWRSALAAEKSAYWAEAASIIGAIGSALLLWQIMLSMRAVAESAAATKQLANQIRLTEEAQRPYLVVRPSLERFNSEFELWRYRVNEGEDRFEGYVTDLILKNVGPLPAFAVRMEVTAVWEGFSATVSQFDEGGLAESMVETKSIKCVGPWSHDGVSPRLTISGTIFYQAPSGREHFTKFSWYNSDTDSYHFAPLGWKASLDQSDIERT